MSPRGMGEDVCFFKFTRAGPGDNRGTDYPAQEPKPAERVST